MDNYALLEEHNIKVAFAPVDLNTAAITGARVSLAKGGRCAISVNLGTSTAASVVFTLRQHNAATSGTSKDLSVANRYWVKSGTATSFTLVEPTVAAAAYDLSTAFAADGGIVVFEVLSEDLDVTNDFSHVSVDVADSTAAKLGAGLYILGDCPFQPPYSVAL